MKNLKNHLLKYSVNFKSAVAFFFLFFIHGTSIVSGQQGITHNVSAMSSGGLRGRIYQTTRSLRAGQDARITYTPAITYSEC